MISRFETGSAEEIALVLFPSLRDAEPGQLDLVIGDFLRSACEGLEGDQTIGEVYTDEQLIKLLRRAVEKHGFELPKEH